MGGISGRPPCDCQRTDRVLDLQQQDPAGQTSQLSQERYRLLEVVEKPAAERSVEGAVQFEVSDIIESETQVWQTQALRYVLALLVIRGPAFDAQHIEPHASEFDCVASLERTEIDHPQPLHRGSAERKTQGAKRGMNQRPVADQRLVVHGAFASRELDVVCRELQRP